MKPSYLVLLTLAFFVLSSCAQPPAPTPTAPPPAPIPAPAPEPAPASPLPSPPAATPAPELAQAPLSPPDTTPPSAIAGLTAVNAYDGRVNLWWERSTAEDFDHYNVYVSKSEIGEASSLTPVEEIGDIATARYQVTGLEDGTEYYFAVTAVDGSGNESTPVATVMATPTPMPRGTSDPDIQVDVYQSDVAYPGTTLLPDNHNRGRPRVIEVNMRGEIVWEFQLPPGLRQYTNPGFDAELLPNNNLLLVLPLKGIYEVDRNGNTVWSYRDKKVSHDADRLPNGNTLVVWGGGDQVSDAQVKEISPEGKIVWSWYARDHFYKSPYKDIYEDGWTHTNAVSRLPNGNTLISPRNFNFLVEVDPQGAVVRTIGEGVFHHQHDPEVLPNGNILIANHRRPHRALEFDPKTGRVVWQSAGFERDSVPVRDANRLPNGNTLITGTTKIVEVTPEGKIVWQLRLKGVTFVGKEAARLGFYKAERIGIQG